MWEEIKVYRQLDKREINPIFRQLGKSLVARIDGYSIEHTNSIIKLFRQKNHLEQSIFIEKTSGSYDLNVTICIKPTDFYRKHKFSMVNIVPLGEILNNYRRTSYPLTQEWDELSVFLSKIIKAEVEDYFQRYDSYSKIIKRRKEIEPKSLDLDNKYELLIYAAIRTRNLSLLLFYLDVKLRSPAMRITRSEFQKPDGRDIDQVAFLETIRGYAQAGDFENIEKEILLICQQTGTGVYNPTDKHLRKESKK
ncbi:hypothetical protein [Dyadobacter bucti]|uniref:hypothetical protein n=1 Tax=Dyadobacter bucti TaxID=2572203 RepID=UPI0011095887|nr:hypothetical protein [Dyadobacter bucti]